MNSNHAQNLIAKYLKAIILIGVFAILTVVMAVPFYSVRSSSLPALGNSKASANSGTPANIGKASRPVNTNPWSPAFEAALSPFATEGIATFNADCITPQTDFFLGDVVCAKASGVPVTFIPWRVLWVDVEGIIRQSNTASTDDSTTYIYQIPTSATSNVDGVTVDNRGNWSVKLARSNGSVRQSAVFVVHELANPVADAYVQKFVHSESPSVGAGGNIAFTIVVGNLGPDPAAAVHLVDSVPTGGTLVQFTQNSGPTCIAGDPGTPNDCIIAAMANGDRAEFTVIYTAGATPGDYTTSATVSSTTPDSNADNNTATAPFTVTTATTGANCQLICPDNVNAVANTTESSQRGAHVSFDDAVSSGDCGSVTASPASGSFFPVGTTVVTVTSETGGGSCTFVVTVDDTGTNPPTISCPANQTLIADSNCGATVTLGTPTTSGDNVTVHGTRSDGLPMYDCDINGNNCVRKTADLPFPAGVTTVVWMATSHDSSGNDEGTASCTQTITVYDVTPPTITVANQTASADANCLAPVPNFSTIATVSDNCACASSDTSQICDTRHDIALTQDVAAGTLVGLGPHTIHLTANDGSITPGPDGIIGTPDDIQGNVTVVTVTFTVNDTTAPTFTFVPPTVIAYTGPNATTCDTVVSNATLGTATATDNCSTVTITRSPAGNTFGVGNTTVVWTATDEAGNHTSANQTVTVIDNTPPTITLNGSAPSMWPPNHKYQTFSVTNFVTSVFDNCGGVSVSAVRIDHVTSDETENGNGDGNTTNDIVIASDCKSVQLRSERDGGGDGRVYTITFRLTDTHGNTTTATARVVVAHNPGETPVDSGVHYTVNGNCP